MQHVENTDPYLESDELERERRAAQEAPVYASIEDLIQPAQPAVTREEDFELESGLRVRIRPITRMEVIIIGKRDLPTEKKEAAYISKALVLPAMTEKDVARWQTNSAAGDMQTLSDRVTLISGMSEKGEKAAAKSFPESGE